MVAKINVGSSLFGALKYNLDKVNEGQAKVLTAHKLFHSTDGTFDMYATLREFESFMPEHCRTEKPVIHISLNPHPDDKLSDEQLSAIASEYMERLGYGNQPYMVCKHEDIDRHHLHIISLRVDETGRKINDKFEFRRSKDITRELEQRYGLRSAEKQRVKDVLSLKKVDPDAGDVKRQIGNVIKHFANRYHYLSFGEYRALLSLYNMGAEEVKGEVKGKPYNGVVYSATDDKGNKVGNPFKSSKFGKSVGYDSLQRRFDYSKEQMKKRKLAPQTKRRATDALHHSTDKSSFQAELRRRGLDVVLRDNSEGRLYGVTFIDHNNGCVLNGSRLGKELSANAITEWFNNPQPIHGQQPSSPAQEHTEHSDTVLYRTEDDGASLGGLFDLPDNPVIDPEEERFRRRMQRKRKGRKL